nr:hypothetical protein [Pedobacter schmidteae]
MKTLNKPTPKKKTATKRKKSKKVKSVSSGNKELDNAIRLALKSKPKE